MAGVAMLAGPGCTRGVRYQPGQPVVDDALAARARELCRNTYPPQFLARQRIIITHDREESAMSGVTARDDRINKVANRE